MQLLYSGVLFSVLKLSKDKNIKQTSNERILDGNLCRCVGYHNIKAIKDRDKSVYEKFNYHSPQTMNGTCNLLKVEAPFYLAGGMTLLLNE